MEAGVLQRNRIRRKQCEPDGKKRTGFVPRCSGGERHPATQGTKPVVRVCRGKRTATAPHKTAEGLIRQLENQVLARISQSAQLLLSCVMYLPAFVLKKQDRSNDNGVLLVTVAESLRHGVR